MKLIEPEVQFDCLSLGVKLYNYFDGFKKDEIQLFSYFSSVLFPYTKEPFSEWKYQYTLVRETSYPFSGDLNDAIEMHLLNGNFEERDGFFIVTSRGIKTFDDIKDLNLFKKREIAINAACTASIIVSYKETQLALLNDPELLKNKNLAGNANWIKQDFVYKRIIEISEKLGVPIDDLMISSVSWIKYLSLTNPVK